MSHLPSEALSYERVVAEYFLALKGAGLSALWPQFLSLLVIGTSVLTLAARRFHKTAR